MEFRDAAAKETAGQAGIAEVKLGALDESLDAIAEPGRQEFDQEQSLNQCEIAADRRPAQFELARHLA